MSLLEEIVAAYSAEKDSEWPFTDAPPEGTPVHEVPPKLRGVIALWHREIELARSLAAKPPVKGNFAWSDQMDKANTVATLWKGALMAELGLTKNGKDFQFWSYNRYSVGE